MKKRPTKILQKGNCKAQVLGRFKVHEARPIDWFINKPMTQALLSSPFCHASFFHWWRLLKYLFLSFLQIHKLEESHTWVEIFIFDSESLWNAKKQTFCNHIGKKVVSLFMNVECEGTLREGFKAQDMRAWNGTTVAGVKAFHCTPQIYYWGEKNRREGWWLTFQRKNIFFHSYLTHPVLNVLCFSNNSWYHLRTL